MAVTDLNQLDCTLQLLPISSMIRANLIAFCILDAIPAVLTLVENGVFIRTLIKTKVLHTPSNILLGAMSVSDFLVGLTVQPIIILRTVFMLTGREHRILNYVYFITCALCGGLSFLFASLISVDRYVAICHPFVYGRLSTCKMHTCVVAIAGTIWTLYCLTIIFSLMHFMMSMTIFSIIAILVILLCYAQISLVISKQKATVIRLGTIDNIETQHANNGNNERKRKKKSVSNILGFFLVCYMPYVAWLIYFLARQGDKCDLTETEFVICLWKELFILMNSFFNPLVYCLGCKDICRSVCKIFRHDSVQPA